MTNREKLMAMTDEALAIVLSDYICNRTDCLHGDCDTCRVFWLNLEVDE